MNHQTINELYIESVDEYLQAQRPEDKELSELVSLAFRKALLKEDSYFQPLKKLPENAPTWMVNKWGSRTFLKFDPDDPLLSHQVGYVVNWLEQDLNTFRDNPNDSLVQWLHDKDGKGRPKKLLKLGTVNQVYREAKKAAKLRNTKLFQSLGNMPSLAHKDENVEVVATFPDGYSIVRLLNSKATRSEGVLMRNCIKSGYFDHRIESKDTDLYSLRDSRNKPHVSLQVDPSTDKIIECEGKASQFPHKKYIGYILEFIKKNKFKLSSVYFDNFGVVEWQDDYYSIYNLPEGIVFQGNLDLRKHRSYVPLPKECTITGDLSLPAEFYDYPPEGVKAKTIRITGKNMSDVLKSNGTRLPARRIWNETGQLISELYLRNGQKNDIHTAEGKQIPALRRWNDAGVLIKEEYYCFGKRNDQILANGSRMPACREWHDNGRLAGYSHYLEGVLHDLGKGNNRIPAVMKWNSKGKVIAQEYYFDGKEKDLVIQGCRIAAIRHWNDAGKFIKECYFLEGVREDVLLEDKRVPTLLEWDKDGYMIKAVSRIDGRVKQYSVEEFDTVQKTVNTYRKIQSHALFVDNAKSIGFD